jgi:Protein of unknown function (DUF4236)
MGLRFRRSWSLIPGVRFNLGLKGGSVSLGTRGLHYTVGTSGSRITAGLPGTGLFWTEKVNSPWGQQQASPLHQPNAFSPIASKSLPPHLPQPQSASPQSANTRPPIQPMPSPVAAPQPPTGKLTLAPSVRHVFLPLWVVWTGFATAAIGGLCVAAAIVGKLLY